MNKSNKRLTQKDFDNISELNEIMQSNEYFVRAVSADPTCRNNQNIVKCEKAIDLYRCLYNNQTLLNKLFKDPNRYEHFNAVQSIIEMMWYQGVDASDAINFWLKAKERG